MQLSNENTHRDVEKARPHYGTIYLNARPLTTRIEKQRSAAQRNSKGKAHARHQETALRACVQGAGTTAAVSGPKKPFAYVHAVVASTFS